VSRSTEEHRATARGLTADCAVLSVSDTRTEATDEGGRRIVESLEAAGHRVAERVLVRDEPAAIDARLRRWVSEGRVEVIVTTGGTGISLRDTTVEVVERLLDKRLDGFGEIFRMLSHREIGAAAMLSRAVAGLAGRTAIFALPGSVAAVRLAMDELIVPELPHLLRELRR
jgi:molybdenum cofactor biosynthesis protein B